jgi:hypothetical protein
LAAGQRDAASEDGCGGQGRSDSSRQSLAPRLRSRSGFAVQARRARLGFG